MNDAIAAITALIVGSVTLTAFFLVVGALFPKRVARTQAMAGSSPGRAFGVGLVNFVFLAAVSFMFFVLADNWQLPFLGLPGTAVLAILVLGLIFGLSGFVQLVGERLAPAQSYTTRTIWGALALCLACATPMVGWFILLPYAAITGLGAFVLSYLYGPLPREAVSAAAPAPG